MQVNIKDKEEKTTYRASNLVVNTVYRCIESAGNKHTGLHLLCTSFDSDVSELLGVWLENSKPLTYSDESCSKLEFMKVDCSLDSTLLNK